MIINLTEKWIKICFNDESAKIFVLNVVSEERIVILINELHLLKKIYVIVFDFELIIISIRKKPSKYLSDIINKVPFRINII